MLRVARRCPLLVLLAGLILAIGSYQPADAAPVAQVYQVRGNVTIETAAGAPVRPLARGAVLNATDLIRLPRGTEAGLYFRDGGRRVLAGGERGLAGRVSDFFPALEPYRNQAVYFGATRGGSDSAAPVPDTFVSIPDEVPALEAVPLFTFALDAPPTERPPLASATLRLLREDTELAAARIEEPAPGQTLVLDCPPAGAGEAYTLQLILIPRGADPRPLMHSVSFYVVIPVAEPAALAELLAPYFYCQGPLTLREGAVTRTLLVEQDLVDGEGEGRPRIATVVTLAPPL